MYENEGMDSDKVIAPQVDPECSTLEERRRRILGSARGTIILHDGWDDPLTDEELKEWYGD